MKISDDEILDKSLELFSQSGYEAVSISDISSSLGISKGALYKHFENKQDLFNKIVEKILEQTKNQFEVINGKQKNLSVLKEYLLCYFDYWTGDKKAVQFRHLLNIEQFRNSEMNKLYSEYLVAQPERFFTQIFENYKLEQAKSLSFVLVSGLSSLINQTDLCISDKNERISLMQFFEMYEKQFFNITEKNESPSSKPRGLLQKASEINNS